MLAHINKNERDRKEIIVKEEALGAGMSNHSKLRQRQVKQENGYKLSWRPRELERVSYPGIYSLHQRERNLWGRS
jgi:hypothetical protein